MTEKEKLLEFLREYAHLLRSKYDFQKDLPLKSQVHMPGACCAIETVRGVPIATVSGDYLSPSMPVGPRDIAYTRLFAGSPSLLIAAKAMLEEPTNQQAREAVEIIVNDIEGES